jgi:HPt (histidine-containing phosphotransfer) domain-containing protein
MTANAVVGQKEMFLANGFDGYLSKPIDLRRLNESLNKFIRDKKLNQVAEPFTAEPPCNDDAVITEKKQKNPVIKIPGIDTEMGISLYAGDADIYIAVLRSYIANALSVKEKLRDVSKETLPEYAVNVHGLKGISAGVGAEELKEAALKLEMMAKAGNLEGIIAENDALLLKTENLVSGIKAWFDEFDSNNLKRLLPCPDLNLLVRLRKCCELYEISSVDDIMEELESNNYEKEASLVEWLREKIDESDFSSMVERLLLCEQNSKPQ